MVSNRMARAGGARAVKRDLSQFSRRKYGTLDGRLVEARSEAQIIDGLSDPERRASTARALLIKRLARANIICDMVECRVIASGDLGDLQARQLIATWNTIQRGFEKLLEVLDPAEEPTSLRAYVGGQ